jgi:hypothetical protein
MVNAAVELATAQVFAVPLVSAIIANVTPLGAANALPVKAASVTLIWLPAEVLVGLYPV